IGSVQLPARRTAAVPRRTKDLHAVALLEAAGESHRASANLTLPRPPRKAVADEKQYLRIVLSEARRSLPSAVRSELSARIQARLLSSDIYRAANSVVLYAACDGEVETALIAADALQRGKRLYYPKIDQAGRRLRLGIVTDPSTLQPGTF